MPKNVEAELARINADLEWWEAAFGRGNVTGWTYRRSASVEWAGKRRSVDAAQRNWLMEHTTRPNNETVVHRIGMKQDAWDAAEGIAIEHTMSVDTVLLQGLRLYQMFLVRLKAGETCLWSGDQIRSRKFRVSNVTLAPDEDYDAELDAMFEGIRPDED